MGVRLCKISSKNISIDEDLRNDYKFHFFINSQNWNIFNSKDKKSVTLKEILKPDYNNFVFEDGALCKGIPTGQEYLDEDGEIINFKEISKENHPDRLKYMITTDNILISSLKGAKVPALKFTQDVSDCVFSNGYYIFKVSNEWNSKFVLYILRTKALRDIVNNYIYRGIGISSYKQRDLLRLKIFNISKDSQNNIVSKIELIETKIKSLKLNIKPISEIINTVFNRELHLNYDKLQELKNEKYNQLTLSDFTDNKDLRNSCKFHCKSARLAMKELCSIASKKIKNYISEPIVLGESVSPRDYDENGSYHYLSMASIKTWKYDEDTAQTVSNLYANSTIKKVKKGDIILARSGEGTIGKVAFIDDNINAVFCDFTMRIRLKDYNPLFAYYYFRTDFFQELIYGYKKGLGNNTNIFPTQIQEFPIPDISLNKQQEIVDEIKSELDKQDEIKSEIINLRNSIERIIEQGIKQ